MNDRQAAEFEAKKELNFAIAPSGIGRFRVNVFMQLGRVGMVMRVIQSRIPTLNELDMPPVHARSGDDQARSDHRGGRNRLGQIDHAGARWSAIAMSTRTATSSPSKTRWNSCTRISNCIVTHREVGVDTDSWEIALKNSLRQAPDVIMIGEIRDRADHGARDRLRRNRPPVPGHAALEQCQSGAGSDHQFLPRGAPCSSC